MIDYQSCLKDEIITLLSDDDNFNVEEMTNICKICEESVDEIDHFHISKNKYNDIIIMDFHFGCAIKEEFVDMFFEENIQGWIPN